MHRWVTSMLNASITPENPDSLWNRYLRPLMISLETNRCVVRKGISPAIRSLYAGSEQPGLIFYPLQVLLAGKAFDVSHSPECTVLLRPVKLAQHVPFIHYEKTKMLKELTDVPTRRDGFPYTRMGP